MNRNELQRLYEDTKNNDRALFLIGVGYLVSLFLYFVLNNLLNVFGEISIGVEQSVFTSMPILVSISISILLIRGTRLKKRMKMLQKSEEKQIHKDLD